MTVQSAAAGSGPEPSRRGTVAEPAPFSSIPPELQAKMRAQEPLKRAAEKVMAVARAGRGDTGFAGLSLEDGFVQVWWKGRAPRAAIAEARRAAAVRVAAAPYSQAELKAAAAPIREQMRADTEITFVTVRTDGSGLTVGVSPAARSATPKTFAVSVPVTIEQSESPRFTSRDNDTEPWWGGAQIVGGDTVRCSTGSWSCRAICTAGFAVTVDSVDGILTAGHCGRAGESWYDGAGDWIGTGYAEHVSHDLLLVRGNVRGNEQGRIYDGGGMGPNPINTNSGFDKQVRGWEAVYPGEYLCHSGARSGAVCNYKVLSGGSYSYCATDVYGTRECYTDQFEAVQADGYPGSQQGDSGGPVFSVFWGDGTGSSVIAKGIISGANSNRLLFQDFYTAAVDFGINVIR
ncbi:hypothetical protein AB0B45_47875 [Nonomuraea sp. NPDC049152]|uniref:hypothetical protein n=1 Tax=Nonomuraea sp. NPDC049152 TaxID=3154350 RepID=UPI0033CB2192